MSPRRVLAGLVLVVVAAVTCGVALVAAVAGLAAGLPDGAGANASGAIAATSGAPPEIPPGMLGIYQAAAATCPGLPAAVLAAIGTVESANGTSDLPGVHSGANAAGAEGPMQFEPATFAQYARPVPPGGADPPSPYDAVDAAFAAARMLCADGAADGVDLPAAVYAYNHSTRYVEQVLALAALLRGSGEVP